MGKKIISSFAQKFPYDLVMVYLFRYFFYTRTRIGYYYHNRDIVKAREKYKDEGHTIIHAADYGSKYTDYVSKRVMGESIQFMGVSIQIMGVKYMVYGGKYAAYGTKYMVYGS